MTWTSFGAHRTSLNRVVGPGRNLALIRASLDQVKQIAHSHDATVNDVLLAVTADGVRGLLRERGEPIDSLAVPVYVSIAPKTGRHQAAGGSIGMRDNAWPLISAESASPGVPAAALSSPIMLATLQSLSLFLEIYC